MPKTTNYPVDAINNAVLVEIGHKSQFQSRQPHIVYVFALFAPLR